MKEYKDYRITCPYCFTKFSHNQVHFRVSEVSVNNIEQRIKRAEEQKRPEKEISLLKSFRRFKENDPAKYKVWLNENTNAMNCGEIETEERKKMFTIPFVTPETKKDMLKNGEYLCDDKGFVYQIEDIFGNSSTTRICPNCHNMLPNQYGRNPQKFITLLGVTQSGKTVYIKQLFARLIGDVSFLPSVGGYAERFFNPNKEDDGVVEQNRQLPDSTNPENLKEPYFCPMTFNGKEYDVILYDIAGENLQNIRDSQAGDDSRVRGFARYVKNADGIILLLDPSQLINDQDVNGQFNAISMLETLRSTHVFGAYDQIPIPVAITISKSDLLTSDRVIRRLGNEENRRILVERNSLIFQNMVWAPGKNYFYEDEYRKVMEDMRRVLGGISDGEEGENAFLTFVSSRIPRRGFFAVSSLVNGVDSRLCFTIDRYMDDAAEYVEELMTVLPVLDRNGELSELLMFLQQGEQAELEMQFSIPEDYTRRLKRLNENISGALGGFQKIRAINEIFPDPQERIPLTRVRRGVTGETVELAVKDIKKYLVDFGGDFDIRDYPRANERGIVQTRRIEEPLLWLLAELKMIKSGYLNPALEKDQPEGLMKQFMGLFKKR